MPVEKWAIIGSGGGVFSTSSQGETRRESGPWERKADKIGYLWKSFSDISATGFLTSSPSSGVEARTRAMV